MTVTEVGQNHNSGGQQIWVAYFDEKKQHAIGSYPAAAVQPVEG